MSAPDRMPDERLADWIDGRMSDREQERFRAELRVNAQLRADLAAYEATVAALRAALQAPTRPAAMGDRVLAAVARNAAVTASAPPRLASRRWLWGLLPAAAALALAFLVDAWQPSGPDTTATLVASAPVAAAAPPAITPPATIGSLASDATRRFEVANAGAESLTGVESSAPSAPAPGAGSTADAAGGGPGLPAKSAAPVFGARSALAGPTPLLEVELGPIANGAGGGRGERVPASDGVGDAKSKGAALDAAGLRAALAVFLAKATDPAVEPAAMAWTTANGELAASPWLDAGVADADATTRVWIVEGPKAEVGELLAAAAAFARARSGVVRNGESKAPPTTVAAPTLSATGGVAVAPTQLVLRVKLRRR
ncbi:MAG: hypothetical protein FJ301_00880 [Planctomycetes bacterium]|nr:hypothetical protein [Planctomycetota bacterium]